MTFILVTIMFDDLASLSFRLPTELDDDNGIPTNGVMPVVLNEHVSRVHILFIVVVLPRGLTPNAASSPRPDQPIQ
jgi:hypothetical protein